MKKVWKRILIGIVIIALAVFIGYKGFYTRVYNQSNTEQDMKAGADIEDKTVEDIVEDMYDLPNRFAGTKSNARAGQYIRNYFRESGLEPYSGDSYYHTFYAENLKNSRYYMLNVKGNVDNIAGKIKGKDSDKAIVITAHMDSFLGKGVLDNASGVAVLLKTAEQLAEELEPQEYPVDIVFTAFNAEECGLLGSKAFYKELSKEYTDFYNINMDCVGAVDKPLAVKNLDENSQTLYDAFLPYLEKHGIPCKDIAYAADEDGIPIGGSDHEAFQEQGKAAIILGEADILGIPNTRKDKDLEMLDISELNRLADTVEDFIVSTDGKIY